MKRILSLAVFLAVVGLAVAGSTPQIGAFATVTFTRNDGVTWIDSGTIVEDHEFRDPLNVGGDEYTYRVIVFVDHVNQYHLDQGRVDIVYNRR